MKGFFHDHRVAYKILWGFNALKYALYAAGRLRHYNWNFGCIKFIKMKDQMIALHRMKSVMILECTACPRLGLAEGAQGTKAICSGFKDILWFSDYEFPSANGHPFPVSMRVTTVDTGNEANCDVCSFTVEVSYDESYTSEKVLSAIRRNTYCKFTIRQDLEHRINHGQG